MKINSYKKGILIIVLVTIVFYGCKQPLKESEAITEKDIVELTELRLNLVSAIIDGDPIAYADQCTDDITLKFRTES